VNREKERISWTLSETTDWSTTATGSLKERLTDKEWPYRLSPPLMTTVFLQSEAEIVELRESLTKSGAQPVKLEQGRN
jgi:hypothetical protein